MGDLLKRVQYRGDVRLLGFLDPATIGLRLAVQHGITLHYVGHILAFNEA